MLQSSVIQDIVSRGDWLGNSANFKEICLCLRISTSRDIDPAQHCFQDGVRFRSLYSESIASRVLNCFRTCLVPYWKGDLLLSCSTRCLAKIVPFGAADLAGERKVLAYSSCQLRKIQSTRTGEKHGLARLRRPVRRTPSFRS